MNRKALLEIRSDLEKKLSAVNVLLDEGEQESRAELSVKGLGRVSFTGPPITKAPNKNAAVVDFVKRADYENFSTKEVQKFVKDVHGYDATTKQISNSLRKLKGKLIELVESGSGTNPSIYKKIMPK